MTSSTWDDGLRNILTLKQNLSRQVPQSLDFNLTAWSTSHVEKINNLQIFIAQAEKLDLVILRFKQYSP
jgi:hypothetical protein